MNKHVLALSTALSILAFTPAFAQENNTNRRGLYAAGERQRPGLRRRPAAEPAAGDPGQTERRHHRDHRPPRHRTASSCAGDLIVPADRLNSVKLMSASDYIGKTVYDQAGNNIGDVNDLIISNDGEVQAVILGVGGFLGMGEKDVAVNTSAVQMVQDGSSTRLVVEATKEALGIRAEL